MKNPWEWEEGDLLELVRAGTQESVELDFKESASLQKTDKKKEDISKDVSAFANSAGGTIVYGVTEDKYTHIATGIDAGSDPKEITKEWLEQVINSTIHRRIDGVRVQQIPLTKTHLDRVAYVVYVPFSTRTAHQAINKKFYKRFNFESVPMEEYEIRDLYRRGETPDLRIEFTFQKTLLIMKHDPMKSEPLGLGVGIFNDALEPANYAIIRILIDSRLMMENARDFSVRSEVQLRIGEMLRPVTMLQLNWNILAKLPIFNHPYPFSLTSNGEPFMLRTTTDGLLEKPASFILGYEIASPRMPLKSSYKLLHVKSGYATLSDDNLSPEELAANYDQLVI